MTFIPRGIKYFARIISKQISNMYEAVIAGEIAKIMQNLEKKKRIFWYAEETNQSRHGVLALELRFLPIFT